MATITLNHQPYTYEQYGKGQHLLLLHGFTGSLENWHPFIEPLALRFTLTLVDILGHGRSASPPDPGRYSITAVSNDLLTLCSHLNIKKFHLLGYSMGGRLALYTAVHHPHRLHSLILESSSPGLALLEERQARTQRDNALADTIETNGIDSFVAYWENLALWDSQKRLSEPVKQQLRQQRLQNNPQGVANSLRGMGTGAQPSLWSSLPNLHCPTLQIVGALDQKFVAINQKMVKTIPNAQLIIIPNTGHTVHLERPSLFTQQLLHFLTS